MIMTPRAIEIVTAMSMNAAGNVEMTGVDWIALAMIALLILFIAYTLTR